MTFTVKLLCERITWKVCGFEVIEHNGEWGWHTLSTDSEINHLLIFSQFLKSCNWICAFHREARYLLKKSSTVLQKRLTNPDIWLFSDGELALVWLHFSKAKQVVPTSCHLQKAPNLKDTKRIHQQIKRIWRRVETL